MKIILLNETEKSQRQSILRAMLKELGFSNIRDFQKAKGLTADGCVGKNTFVALYAAFLPTTAVNFEGCYYALPNDKHQIVLHHAAGWNDARKMFDAWRMDSLRHVATAIGISGDGTVIKGFDEENFAVHIGAYDVGLPNYLALESGSIGCELANWGALEQRNGQYFTWVNDYGKRGTGVTIPANNLIKLGYKNVDYYERYTAAQIESLRRWLMLQAIRFNIPLRYDEKAFWQVSPDAIAGKAGLYTHNSFVEWKTDISPQPAIIAMLKTFNNFATW